MKTANYLLLVVLTSICSACFGGTRLSSGVQCDSVINTYFKLPRKEQVQKFTLQSQDDQYVIYMCGSQAIEPPVMGFAGAYASEGAAVVPFLKNKLQSAGDDLTVRDLVLVFNQMNTAKTYDVVHDNELIDLIKQKVAGMKDAQWKQITEKMVPGE